MRPELVISGQSQQVGAAAAAPAQRSASIVHNSIVSTGTVNADACLLRSGEARSDRKFCSNHKKLAQSIAGFMTASPGAKN